MHDPSGDFQRLLEALEEQWNFDNTNNITADLFVHQKIQRTLRKGKWKITIALRAGNRIIDIWPGLKQQIYGAAVDVGSTTISVHMVDLHSGTTISSSGGMNPQIRFGEDLMSRVSYVMMNPGGEDDLSKAVQTGIEDLVKEAAKNLYSTLRKIKNDKYKSIAVCKIPNKGLGKTINDRLIRASKF